MMKRIMGISGKRAPYAAVGEGGFTIVELLVSVVILVFVSIALMQTAIVNIEFNTKNAVRDEGVRLASEKLDIMRNVSSTAVPAFDGTEGDVPRRIRNITDFNFHVANTVAAMSGYGHRMSVYVEWEWKGEIFNTTVSTVR
jgi:type II secretory pathway pseudopilin PulG